MQPAEFASALQMTNPEQGKRLEAFLSAVQRVAQDPTGSAPQHQAPAAAPPAGAAGTKKKRATPETEPHAASAPVKKKKSVASRGLQAPRVSGLKRPLPAHGVDASDAAASAGILPAAVTTTTTSALATHTPLTVEPAPAVPPATAAVTASSKTAPEQTVASTDVQHHQPEPIALEQLKPENSVAETPKNTLKKKGSKDRKPGKEKKTREVPQRQQEQQQHQKQREEASRQSDSNRERRGKLLAWASSVLDLKHKFDTGVTQQTVTKSKRVRHAGRAAAL